MGASDSQFLFQISGINFETRVVGFDAIEAISCTYEVNLTLALPNENKINFDDVAGHEAVLTVLSGTSAPYDVKTRMPVDINRYFHGIISKFEYAGRHGTYNIFHTRLVPSLWLLSLERDCRIFQNKSLEKIISTVLDERKINGDRVRFALNRKDITREYCVQYRETDLNFISRLMEEEGIFYFFEHEKDRHTLVITDKVGHCFPIKGKSAVVFNTSDGLNAAEESIAAFNFSQRIRPGAFTHTSFNFEHTSNDLKVDRQGKHFNSIEVYDYSGKYLSQEAGRTLAEIRLEEQKLLKMKGKGLSNCPRLTPGYTFTLSDGDSNLPEKDYLIAAVAHSGEQPQSLDEHGGGACGYENGFISLPAKTPFRPNRITPKPVITGLQTATVVGPKGEEIHTDEYGRVRVHFHWDREGKRDERSSCWIRVGQAWGGLTRGAQYIPRIGDEVLVDFLEGDPDRPIITGSVYNSDNMPINDLNKSITQSGFKTKTHKGDGFHELRFDDEKGKEEIYLQSEKDWNVLVKNRKGLTIGGDSGTVIRKNRDTSVGGDSYTIIKGVSTEKAKEIVVGAEDKLTIVSGASSIVISPEGIEINAPLVKVNCGGGASMPIEKPVTGCTGKGAGNRGSSAPSAKPSPTPASSPPQAPEKAAITDPAPVVNEEEPLGEFAGTVPSGGWAGLPSMNEMPVAEEWKIGSISDNVSGLGDLVSTGTPSSLLSGMRLPTSGDLVSSMTSSLPGDLVNNASRIASIAQNPESIKSSVIDQVQNRVTGEITSSTGKLVEETGMAGAQTEAERELEKLRSLLNRPKVKKDGLVK